MRPNPYLFIVIFIGVALVFPLVPLALAWLWRRFFQPPKPGPDKTSTYECGVESIGDAQLAAFKMDPQNRGKVMDRGLWRYTRHPNYFGDAAQWWGFYLIALAAGGWWTIFAPLIMTLLLLRVSGVALLEKTLETRPGYKEYTERTSSFIPWLPRTR